MWYYLTMINRESSNQQAPEDQQVIEKHSDEHPIENFLGKRKDIEDRNYLPENFGSIAENPDELKSMYDFALSYWQDVFDQDEFLDELRLFLETPPEERKNKSKKYFRKIRKAIIILGNIYHFTNQNQSLPEEQVTFIIELGLMKDAFNLSKANQHAEQVVEILENHNLMELDFSVASMDQFNQRIREFKTQTLELLNENVVSLEPFHIMRQELRYLMNLFRIKSAQNPDDSDRLQIFQYLGDIVKDLGKIHEHFVKGDLDGTLEYKHETVEIPEQLKERIIGFLEHI